MEKSCQAKIGDLVKIIYVGDDDGPCDNAEAEYTGVLLEKHRDGDGDMCRKVMISPSYAGHGTFREPWWIIGEILNDS
jgi:hypothetical protein